MPAYVATYSQEQRAALCRAVLVDGMSVRAALDAAKAGKLPGLGAEDAQAMQTLSYTYACQIVRDHKDELDGVQLARSQPKSVSKDAATLLLRRAQRDAQTIANARKGLMDADAALKTLRVIEACQKVLAGLEPRAKDKGEKATESKAPRSLAAQIAARSNAEPDDTTTELTHNEVSALAHQEPRDSATDQTNGGPARVNVALPAAVALAGGH